MDKSQRHQIEQECARLSCRFLHLIRQRDHSELADFFTEDGSLQWNPEEPDIVGVNAIRESFLHVPKSVALEVNLFIVTNVIVDVIDESNATGQMDVIHYQHIRKDEKEEGPWFFQGARVIVPFVHEYRCVDSEWKIARQTVRVKDAWVRRVN